MAFFFTSDLHFGHRNIIDFCNRPFNSADEMNREMIKRWNDKVSNNDTVIVVGDVFLCSTREGEEHVRQLNGKKILIKGNHDRSTSVMKECGFDEVHKQMDFYLPDGRKSLVKHYPVPNCFLKGYDVMIHGHIHLAPKVRGKHINVSTDMWNFSPISLFEIQDLSLETPTPDSCEFKINENRIQISGEFHIDDFSEIIDKVYSEAYSLRKS